MARAEIQDSDAEESDVSPVKSASPAASLQPEILVDPSTSSIVREADETHASLITTTPSSNAIEDASTYSRANIQSPTISKVKRYQTTMDLVSSGKKKIQKTYGAGRTTLDDMALQTAVVSEDWAGEEDEVQMVPEKKRRKLNLEPSSKSGEQPPNGEDLDGHAHTSTSTEDVGQQETGGVEQDSSNNVACHTSSQVPLPSQAASASVSLSQEVSGALEFLSAIPDVPKISTEQQIGMQLQQETEGSGELDTNAAPHNTGISTEEPTFEHQDPSGPSLAETEDHKELNEDTTSREKNPMQEKTSGEQRSSEVVRLEKLKRKASVASSSKNGTTKKRKKELDRAQEENKLDDPASEEAESGLPKEQYKPRPSRSRRGDLSEEYFASIDFSAVPERANRKKTKLRRNKTTNDLPVHTTIDDDDEAGDELGKPSRRSIQKFSKIDNMDMTQDDNDAAEREGNATVEPETKKLKRGRPRKNAPKDEDDSYTGHVIDEVAEDEVIPVSKKRGRKKKVDTEPAISAETVNEADSDADVDGADVQHVSNDKSKQYSHDQPVASRNSRTKTKVASDEDDSTVNEDSSHSEGEDELATGTHRKKGKPRKTPNTEPPGLKDAPPVPEAPKQSKRGRPKKNQGTSATETNGAEADKEAKPQTTTKRGRPSRANMEVLPDPLQDEEENEEDATGRMTSSQNALRDKTSTSNISRSGSQQPASEDEPKPDKNVDVQTPKKPKAEKKAGNHSPLSSGRIPYRVGLSRRQRIQPLLSFVKK